MSDLKRIVQLAELLRTHQTEIERLEEELKQLKAAALRIEREDLPLLMTELGLQEIKLGDGSVVKVSEDCDARISDATRTPALAWLNEHGFGGLIKTQIALTFGRGEHDKAIAVQQRLAADFDNVELKEDVHYQTLKAFVKEQLAAGASIPMDLFNVFPYSKATIKAPRK